MTQAIALSSIRTDGGTQSRVTLSEDTVAEYADAMTEGATLPPVVVYHDGADYWLADGFHRYFANQKIGAVTIEADVRQGARRDAVLHACSANGSHGLRRTTDDKRKAVLLLLNDEEWGQWSDREIARRCAVSHPMVAAARGSLEKSSSGDTTKRKVITKHGTTTEMDTGRIGKGQRKQPEPVAPQPEADQDLTEDEQLAEDAHGGVTLVEELEAAHKENETLRDLLAVAEAADQTKEALRWRRAYDNACMGQAEAMARAKEAADREAQTMRWLRRVGKAVGEDNPARIPATVEMFVGAVQVSS
jgi:hypothetical protein